MTTIVKTLLKSAMPKDKDKSGKVKKKDKGKDKSQSRSIHVSVAPTLPPKSVKPPGVDPPRATTWVGNSPPLVATVAPPRFTDLRDTGHDPSARDKVGPWIQAHAGYTEGYEFPEAPPNFPSRTNSPAATVHPQESISVIGVGRGVPRGHQTMQSFSALQETPRVSAPARPLSEVMSRGAPAYQARATNSPTTGAFTRSPASRGAESCSGNSAVTPKPHLHQPRPEHPFDYAEAQEAREREERRHAELAEAVSEQRRVDLIAAREAAEEAERVAQLVHARQTADLELRDLLKQFGPEDAAARREMIQDYALKDAQAECEIRERRERQEAYDAALARLVTPLMAGNIQDKHDSKWDNVFSAADMRPRGLRDTFSTESFGHKHHANGRPIPAPLSQVPPSPQPATVINERAARADTISEHSAKVAPKSHRSKRADKHTHRHSHSPAQLLQSSELTRNLTFIKSINEHELDESGSEADAVSQMTRLTKIAKLVDDSTFHDDTLCQLLDASRLNLIGDQAKKTLMRAARKRVEELKRKVILHEADQSAGTPPLKIHKKVPGGSAPVTPNATTTPLPPCVAETPLPACQPSQHPAAAAAESRQNEEVLREICDRLIKLSAAFEAAQNRGNFDIPGGFSAGNVPQMQPQAQMYPPMAVDVPTQGGFQTLPQAPLVFQQPPPPAPPQGYHKFEEQPLPDMTQRVGPNGYIPTGGHADEYMMGGGSIHSIPTTAQEPVAKDAPSPVPSSPVAVTQDTPKATPRSAPQLVPESERTEASKVGTEGSRAASKASKAATKTSRGVPTEAYVSRASTQAASAVPSSARTPTGPIINIFSPTTIQGEPTQSRAFTEVPSTPAQQQPVSSPPTTDPSTGTHTVRSRQSVPPGTSSSSRAQPPAQVVVLERELPPLPESVASHLTRTTTKPGEPPTTVAAARAISRAVTSASNSTPGPEYDSGGQTTVATHVVGGERPWDIVVRRLHAMAAVWQEDNFERAMNSASLKRELDIVPLTIYTMTIYKSYLRNRLTALNPMPADKLLVAPVHAETINSYIFAKKYNEAAALLTDLWSPLSNSPPRVIIAMTKHGYQEGWLAHRWDLTTGHLTSHHCVHIETRIDPYDKRPFNWWHAIRAAFPERGVFEPRLLLERNVRHVYTATPSDNSLRAALVTRNLLNGNKSDVDHGLSNLRDTVWKMTQQLLKKKQAGELLPGPASA
ncbi:hypothetical protein CC85DRAFT_324771 [Cutaneotrichosporon oleaginosum]|uniref:Uncharacterized protein n=1 Tax=Cutaneotrichosporon oleaginosum TaxID=879819 RepID=A0A0J0XZJ6_9TREE|nr:uncharacterized protein CC85DRAFT_324771 [Cutaneotrichosporon oleaginosum]KLT46455.1 hypothetical protein CC85DRAFT_324771 [Cutaneotrichosporon oleaginosum]TXT15177.1 hypothetical protein COLE_01370 [Cutaneotrichosporon oleaginosum]